MSRPKRTAASVLGLLAAVLSNAASMAGAQDGTGDLVTAPEARRSYVVVACRSTWNDPEWRVVIETLRAKHEASLVLYGDQTGDREEGAAASVAAGGRSPRFPAAAIRRALSRWMPRYTCFVARPEELGRETVVAIHRLTRALDHDPYGDTLWGILTGYDASDALRIARRVEPLLVRRGLGGTGGLELDLFDEAIGYDEGRAGGRRVKPADGPTVDQEWPADSTGGLVDGLNEFGPDLFMTSGHATEHDWQIGYAYHDGQFRCEDGTLFGLDTRGRRHPVHSPNPKIYMPCGNCLIGNIPGRDCMALAFIHSAGVDQMFGYTAVTFDGYMGWGIKDLFLGRRGRYTLAEAFFFNEQALIAELESRFPDKARIDFDSYGIRDIDRQARRHELGRQELGLLWDRDVVAFYGDPAWVVRLPAGECGWKETLEEHDGRIIYRIETLRAGSWGGRPLVAWLPRRRAGVRVERGEDYMPVVTDDFLLVPLHRCAGGTFQGGETYEIVVQGETVESRPTSSGEPPYRLSETDEADEGSGGGRIAPGGGAAAGTSLPDGLDLPDREAVERALARAGENAGDLCAALEKSEGSAREAVAFLIANMPDPDLRTFTSEQLLNNVTLALAAREAVPWGRRLPDEIFLDEVLPYACVNERRDDWRPLFFDKLLDLVRDCTDPAEAAQVLNQKIFDLFEVHYHATKRPKADQSPLESIAAGYASCTGLSIMLVDACRSVCVPARFVGIPQWTTMRGNHSWVEIWDGGWHFTGAAEYDPKGLDRAWFVASAAQADPEERMHRIYASRFTRTDLRFPLVWDLSVNWVSAVDVTGRYVRGGVRPNVRVEAFDRRGGARVACHVRVWRGDELVTEGWTRDAHNDTNDRLSMRLEPSHSYGIELQVPGRKTPCRRTIEPAADQDLDVVFFLDEE